MLLAVTSTDVAFVAAVAAGIGAGAGPLTTWWTSRAERKHQTELSRRQLLHDQMRAAYADFLERVYEVADLVNRLQPRPYAQVQREGSPPTLARYVGDEPANVAWRHSAALASTVASEEVADAMNDVMEVFGEFVRGLGMLEGTPDDQRTPAQGADLQAKRDAITATQDELERLMRADVRR